MSFLGVHEKDLHIRCSCQFIAPSKANDVSLKQICKPAFDLLQHPGQVVVRY